ncbi:MAG: SOS response-associated peptidase family protein [Sphingomonadaceae bacterium]
MNWGLTVDEGQAGPAILASKPVNNARTDKLEGFFWRSSFEQRRCLDPAHRLGGGEERRAASRAAGSLCPARNCSRRRGVWRQTDEWGDAYSMVMTDAAGRAAEVHTRMPVLLAPQDYAQWIKGSPAEAFELCRPWQGDLAIDRTQEPWAGGGHARLL